MKKLKYSFLLFLTIFIASCKLLDQTSPNDVSADNAIKDGAGAESALIGMYSSMQGSNYYGGQYLLIADALTDNCTTGGYQAISIDQMGNRAVTPVNVLTEGMWIAAYRVIANANNLLAALPDVKDLSTVRKNDIEGQARAIRALAHFDLLRFYGEHWNINSEYGIPNVQKPQTINDKPQRATVQENYQAILDDFNAAVTLIDPATTTPQYVNINTVNALLARVYLYKKDMPKAVEFSTKVISSTQYSLMNAADYSSIFTTRRSEESIFELAFDSQNRSTYNALVYGRTDALRSELFYLASKNLGDFFSARPNDVRGTLLNTRAADNDVTIQPDGRTEKYRGETTRDNPAYIIRFAEMYLIRAEAKGRSMGLNDLNIIRNKRGIASLTAGNTATDDAFINAVLNERRAEFNFEGHRFFDLARTDKATSVLGVAAFRKILPIPGREVSAAGLKQNPQY